MSALRRHLAKKHVVKTIQDLEEEARRREEENEREEEVDDSDEDYEDSGEDDERDEKATEPKPHRHVPAKLASLCRY
jgi:hypothetical protein